MHIFPEKSFADGQDCVYIVLLSGPTRIPEFCTIIAKKFRGRLSGAVRAGPGFLFTPGGAYATLWTNLTRRVRDGTIQLDRVLAPA